MTHPVSFTRHLAHLLWLVLNEPANVDEQKAALRLLLTSSRQGPMSIGLHGLELQANGSVVPTTLTGVSDLMVQMARHGLALVDTDEHATAAELLGVVRILASKPVLDDGGISAESQRVFAGIGGIRFTTRPAFTQEAPMPAPVREAATVGALDFGEVLDEPLATPLSAETTLSSYSDGEGGVSAEFAVVPAPIPSPDALLAQLESAVEADDLAQVLEDLVMIGEAAARQGDARVVGEILYRLGRRETELPDVEQREATAVALKRIGKPVVLRLVARDLPHDIVHRDQNLAVLARAEAEGADALIDQITSLTQQRDRRVYFEALLSIKSGLPALLHMLGDVRWFVVRRAVDLLGEMQVAEAEGPVSLLLNHEDERIRSAAASALMCLGTPRALEVIERALADLVPVTRMQAAAALMAHKDALTAGPHLLRALDVEKDDEVKATLLAALGKLGTPEAVQRLVNASEQKRGLFRRKATSVRVAAVIGLAEARTEEAMSALRALHDDRDDDVRAAVTQALGQIARAAP